MKETALTILVVEDNPGDYALVNAYIQELLDAPIILHADTLQKAIEILPNSTN